MNIFKNLLKEITKEKISLVYSQARELILSMTFMKITAIVVVNCFLLTSVYGQAVASVMDNNRATAQFKQIFQDFELPYSYGKITTADYRGSDKVVVNIQDLHSHPEVQRNISRIIDLFDSKYGVKNIYLEGAYGQVSTKWLTDAKEENVRNAIMDKLIDTGRLTGAEYYSALKNKTEIIKGLENKEQYFDNLKRFGTLLDNQNNINFLLDEIQKTVKTLQNNYYNRQQKKIEELSASYVSGNTDPKKYFVLMAKHAEKLGVDINNYENLALYMRLMESQKNIDYTRTTQELQMFVLKLKEVLPYNAYKMLVDSTQNFQQMDKLYGYIIKLSRQYNLNLSVNFPELEKFFAYMELSQKINPLQLIKEEQNFKDEINDKFAANKAEEEVVFISNFIKYYRDYLTSKITSDDCKYYQANIDKFKYLWVKYIDDKQIVAMAEYEEISDKFYAINLARNNYFLANIDGIANTNKLTVNVTGTSELEKVMSSLKDAKEIYIVITGGFHTQGVSDLLAQKNITNIVITPNVTGDTKAAEETYYKIAQEQSKISFQALATLPMTLLNPKITDIVSLGNNKFSFTVTDDADKYVGEMTIEGNKGIITSFEKVADSGKTESRTESQQKSVDSVKKSLRAATGLSAFFAIATLVTLPILIFTGTLPIVIVVTGLLTTTSSLAFLGIKRNLTDQQKVLLEAQQQAAENQAIMSDAADKRELLKTVLNSVSEKTRNSILKVLGLSSMEGIDGLDETGINNIFSLKGEGELFEVLKEEKKIVMNPFLLKAFLDYDKNIKNQYLLETFLLHELRHINHKWMPEFMVGFGDLGSYFASVWMSLKNEKTREKIKIFIQKIFNKDALSKQERLEYGKTLEWATQVLGADYVEMFQNRQERIYKKGAGTSNKTTRQIISAAVMVKNGIVELGTGAGKSDAFKLAVVKLLAEGKDILFLTNTADLAKRDIEAMFRFVYDNEEEMIKLGVIKTDAQTKKPLPLQFGFVHESDDSKNVLYSWDSKNKTVITENTTKKDVYRRARVVAGSSMSAFVWDRQKDLKANADEKTITQKKWRLLIDEIHRPLIQGANDTFTISEGNRDNFIESALFQRLAGDVAGILDGSYYTIEGRKVKINTSKKAEIVSKFRKLLQIAL